MRVVTVCDRRWNARSGPHWSEHTARLTLLTRADIDEFKVVDRTPTSDGDGHLLRPGLQAYVVGIAHEFDPPFSLSISRG